MLKNLFVILSLVVIPDSGVSADAEGDNCSKYYQGGVGWQPLRR
jgi:hypothetical protein